MADLLSFDRLTATRILAADAGALIAGNALSQRLDTERAIPTIAGAFASASGLGPPRPAEGHLASPDRIERVTIPAATLAKAAPLRVRGFEDVERSGCFDVGCTSVDFFRTGVVGIAFSMRLDDACEGRLKTEALLEELRAARECVEIEAEQLLRQVATLLSDALNVPVASSPLADHCEVFEVIDFAQSTASGVTAPGEVLRDGSAEAKRELAGFLRMSRPGVWTRYSDDVVERIRSSDLGNREDDFWLVMGRRLFRYHPDARSDVAGWFEDLILATSISLAQIAALERQAELLRQEVPELLLPATLELAKVDDIAEDARHLALVESLVSRVSDAGFVGRGVGHSFFREVLEAVQNDLRLREVNAVVRERLRDLQVEIQSLVGFRASSAALAVSRSTEALTRRLLWLTLAMLALVAVQIVVAIVGP